jgi:mercuric ion binding protein
MKGYYMNILTYVGGLLLLASGAAFADPQKARIEVSGLFCPSCSYIAGEALEQAESVEVIEQILAETGGSAVYVVTYDDAATTLAEIVAKPVSLGYGAELVSDDSNS